MKRKVRRDTEKILILFLLAGGMLIGCGSPRILTDYKQEALEATATGNAGQALDAWQSYFNQKLETEEDVEGATYAQAAKTAFEAGEEELAVSWFDQARYRNYADEEMYAALADIFRGQDNLSKELNALEYYRDHFKEDIEAVNERLFSIYHEIEMHKKALDAWKLLPEKKMQKEENLEKYFFIHQEMDHPEICDSVSLELLEINPEHIGALEWNAKKYYWMAENRYQREMEAYNNNKTRRQYRLLLKELDKSTADYKKSLGYFEKLWDLNNEARKAYAAYLATIHARFNDKQKANHYKEFLD